MGVEPRKEIDTILVWRLDRWGRSLVDLVTTLQELAALKVGFVSLSEALDMTTPSGRAFAGMLAVFAEFERDILRPRQGRHRPSPQGRATPRASRDRRQKSAGNQEARQERPESGRHCQAAQHRPNFRPAVASSNLSYP